MIALAAQVSEAELRRIRIVRSVYSSTQNAGNSHVVAFPPDIWSFQ